MILNDCTFFDEYQLFLKSKNFVYGGGLLSPDKKYFYVHIPKNASSYFGKLFTDHGWTVGNLMELDNIDTVQPVIFVRDPVERWISGFAQYAMGLKPLGSSISLYYNSMLENLIFDQIIFDDHTLPQYYFFHKANINLDRLRCYNLKSGYEKYFQIRFLINLKPYDNKTHNRSIDDKEKQQTVDFLTKQLEQRPDLVNKIKKRYETDYWLIKHYAI